MPQAERDLDTDTGALSAHAIGEPSHASVPKASPTAELRIIDGAGHIWNLQLPELFNQTTAEAIGHA